MSLGEHKNAFTTKGYTAAGEMLSDNGKGPGGWAAILMYKEHIKEISGGYRKSTNSRVKK